MAFLKKYSRAFLAFVLILCLMPLGALPALAESDGMIRVKLTRLGSPDKLVFTTGCAYFINNKTADKIPSGSTVTLTLSGGKFTLKSGSINRTFDGAFTLNRKNAGTSGVKFTTPSTANVFCGDFRFSVSSSSIMTVMTIYVEDYLYGVVGYEMSNSYPVEALKAQAIAARNYALRCKATRSSREYDLTDTSSDQVFKGYNSSYANVIAAVDGTRGVALYYGSALASCYYGASNGGQTESTKNAWGSKLAYSVVKDDKYDLESGATYRSAVLKKNQSGESMNNKLRAALLAGMSQTLSEYDCSAAENDVTIDEIVSIEPVSPKYAEPSRLFTQLRFTVKVTTVDSNGKSASGSVTVDVPTYGGIEDWFSLSINSGSNETVWVDDTGDSFTITFRRWGHGIGMSQRGARIMAKNYSLDYRAILDFYYPGTEIRSVVLADKTGAGLDGTGGGDVTDWGTPIDRVAVSLSDVTGTVNMRKSASTTSAVLITLNHGTVVDLYRISGDWAAVGYSNYLGYIQKKYLAAIDEGEPTAAPTQTAAPTATPTPAAAVTPSPTIDTGSVYVKVNLSSNSSRLKLRKKASTSSAVVSLLKNGKTLKLLQISGKWAKVLTVGGKTGFVYRKYLKTVTLTTPVPSASATPAPTMAPPAMTDSIPATVKSDTFIFKKSSVTSSAVMGLSTGDSVTVLAYSANWAYVQFGSAEGYVQIKYLKRTD